MHVSASTLTALLAVIGLEFCSVQIQRSALAKQTSFPDFRTIASNQHLLLSSVADDCLALASGSNRSVEVSGDLKRHLKSVVDKSKWLNRQDLARETHSKFMELGIVHQTNAFGQLVNKFAADPDQTLLAIQIREAVPKISHDFDLIAGHLGTLDSIKQIKTRELGDWGTELGASSTAVAILILASLVLARTLKHKIDRLVLVAHSDQLREESRIQAELQQIEREAQESTLGHLDAMTQACGLLARRYELLFQMVPVAMLGIDESGTIFEYNEETSNAFGVNTTGILHRQIGEFVPEREQTLVRRMLRSVFRGNRYRRVDWTYKLEDGQKRRFLFSVTPMPGADGSITAAIATFEEAPYASRRKAA